MYDHCDSIGNIGTRNFNVASAHESARLNESSFSKLIVSREIAWNFLLIPGFVLNDIICSRRLFIILCRAKGNLIFNSRANLSAGEYLQKKAS